MVCMGLPKYTVHETYPETLGFQEFPEGLLAPQPQGCQVPLAHLAWQKRHPLGHPSCLGVLVTQKDLKCHPD